MVIPRRRLSDAGFPQKETLMALSTRLMSCEWFANVGTHNLPQVARAISWDDVVEIACTYPANQEWEAMLLDAANEMSLRAFQDDGQKYNSQWNMLAVAVIAHVDPLLAEAVSPRLPPQVAQAGFFGYVRGIFRKYFLYISYFDDPDIYCITRDLAELFLIGSCPCGYRGKYPSGSLIVY